MACGFSSLSSVPYPATPGEQSACHIFGGLAQPTKTPVVLCLWLVSRVTRVLVIRQRHGDNLSRPVYRVSESTSGHVYTARLIMHPQRVWIPHSLSLLVRPARHRVPRAARARRHCP